MSHAAYLVLGVIMIMPGFFGIFLPFLPGIPFMFVVALVSSALEGFTYLHGWELLVLGLIALISVAVDYGSGMIGAKYGGASRRSAAYGTLALLVGSILVPPFGGVVAMVAVIAVTELASHGDSQKAITAASGSFLGYVGGIVANSVLGISFIGLFILFSWK